MTSVGALDSPACHRAIKPGTQLILFEFDVIAGEDFALAEGDLHG